MSEKSSKKGGILAKNDTDSVGKTAEIGARNPNVPDYLLVGIVNSLLSNPSVFPSTNESGLIQMARRVRQELLDSCKNEPLV